MVFVCEMKSNDEIENCNNVNLKPSENVSQQLFSVIQMIGLNFVDFLVNSTIFDEFPVLLFVI